MSLAATAEIVTILGGSIGATNVVGSTIHNALQSIRPYSKFKKWTIRVEHIAAVVASAAAEGDLITPKELKGFIRVLREYADARDLFLQRIKDGTCTWYGKGKGYAEDFCDCARDAFYSGHYLSTEASSRKLQLCLLNNAEPSAAAQEPATSTTTLLNKGKSREECSLSKGSPLKNGPHSKKFFDTAKLSQPSTSDLLASSGSCLPNESQTSFSRNSDHPLPSPSLQDLPLYSESEGDNDAILSVNLEDDTEDDSNDVALDEVQAVYNIWRQIPEEQNPCASTATFYSAISGVEE